MKSWLIGKDCGAGRDWGQEEKGTTEDGMAGWHHRLDGCEFELTRGGSDGQGGLACCDSWGCKESDTTEQLNWTDWNIIPLQRPYLQYQHTGELELQYMNFRRIQTFSINRILSVKICGKIWPQIQKAHDLSNLTFHHKSNWLSHEVMFTFSPTYLSNLKTCSTLYLEGYFYFIFIFGCTESLLLFTGFL